jgi:hypothetical protein
MALVIGTPSINTPTEALNQGICWRIMLDSNYHPGVRINTEGGRARNTFYAIFLRHLSTPFNITNQFGMENPLPQNGAVD